MNETWLAFLAGTAWLAIFTAGLFAFANWVQRRDRRRRDEPNRSHYDQLNVSGESPPRQSGEI